MKANEAYYYRTDDGHKYWLSPEWDLTPGDIRVIGAGILDMDGRYIGYWDHFNMPLSLVNSLKKWVRFNRSVEIAERRHRFVETNRKRF